MARLKLSPSGLRSPLDLSVVPVPGDVAPAEAPAPRAARLTAEAPVETPAPAGPVAASAAAAPVDSAPSLTDSAPSLSDSALSLTDSAPSLTASASSPTPSASSLSDPEPSATATADASGAPAVDQDGLPEWARGLSADVLGPDRLLGRPKQTALIMDRDLSGRADALVAATGPRVTFAALVTAVLHFELPADGEAAARAIGGYRRRQLETLDRPWEERNARLPEALRRELDEVVAGATGRVASVRRSTLVNALLDAHLPGSPDEASRLVMRMEMVRGGAFLDAVA